MTGFADPEDFVPPANEHEFELLMDRLDSWLEARGMPAAMRQLAAIAELSFTSGLNGRVPRQRTPRSGVYSGEDLVLHGADWYDRRYGDALKVIRGPGRSVVVVRSDTFGLRFPMVVGEAYIRCNTDNYPRPSDGNIPRAPDGKPDINVLEYLEEFPEQLARVLSDAEREYLTRHFITYLPILVKARFLHGDPLIGAALADSEAAVNSILGHPPHFGAAKWSTLQAAEKALKAYEMAKTGGHSWGHELSKVAEAAEEAGLTGIDRRWISAIQCDASVRYGTPAVPRAEAVEAHYSSLHVIGVVAEALHDLRAS